MSVIDKTTDLTGPDSFAARVDADSGANLLKCYQCQKCTSGCPVAARADLKPHELVRLVQLGQEGDVLASRMIWECTSCQTCFARCPHGVDIAAMNDALRRMSRAAGAVAEGTTVPTFNDIFLRTIRKRGRMYEMGLMTAYKLRTGRLLADVGKFPMMLWKGKLPLRGKKVPGKAERKAMFRRAEQADQADQADDQQGRTPGGDRP
jgi:heterodisulfide reductase subunit C